MARALEVMVGERWTLLILRDAFFGVRRVQTTARPTSTSPKQVLSARLSGLVDDGILEDGGPIPSTPGDICYELTTAGRDLGPLALHALLMWATSTARPTLACSNTRRATRNLMTTANAPRAARPQKPQDILTEPRRGRRRQVIRRTPSAVALRTPHRLLEPIET